MLENMGSHSLLTALLCLAVVMIVPRLVQPLAVPFDITSLRNISLEPEAVRTANLVLSQAPPNITCDPLIQIISLGAFYYSTNGDYWLRQQGWLDNNLNCTANLPSSSVELPPHCCWEGVKCCQQTVCPFLQLDKTQCNCTIGVVVSVNLTRNNLTGPFPSNFLSWEACQLRSLQLTFNNMTGTLEEDVSNLQELENLALGYNSLTGTIPANLSMLTKLQNLDLTANRLTGSIPRELCRGSNASSSIVNMLLASNNLTGTLKIPLCDSMVLVDVSNNRLTGTLPPFEGYGMLHIARLGNNSFSGPIPENINMASSLSDYDVSNNALSGVIPWQVGQLYILSKFSLRNNNLGGTIPDFLFQNLGVINSFDVSSNWLQGTIPKSIGEAETVTIMDLSDNCLVGTIPMEMRQFAKPGIIVKLSSNVLSCCGTRLRDGVNPCNVTHAFDAYLNYNLNRPLLPSWLKFSTFMQPILDRSGVDPAGLRCPGLQAADSGDDDPNGLLDWSLDPEYYMYQGCVCDKGLTRKDVWINGTLAYVECNAEGQGILAKYPWIVAIIVVVGTVACTGLMLFLCLNRRTRPAFIQNLFNMRKRLSGAPKSGHITIVNTDIEGYSDLMKKSPDLMTIALSLHNNAVERARWRCFGCILEQEGDSFTVAFHDAFDAVAFCLQFQLMLNKVEWPQGLWPQEGQQKKKHSMLSQALQGAVRAFKRDPSLRVDKLPPAVTPEPSMTAASGASADEHKVADWAAMGRLAPNAPIPEEHSVTMQGMSMSMDLPTGSSLGPLTPHAVSTASPLSFGSKTTQLFSGLRVRMGIASGYLSAQTPIRTCSVFEAAKMVGDVGAGGQILMDDATYAMIKDRMLELGAVDQNGLSINDLHDLNPPWWHKLIGREVQRQDKCAVILDMGQYAWCPSKKLPEPFNSISLSSISMARAAASFRSASISSSHTAAPAAFDAGGDPDALPPATQRTIPDAHPVGSAGPGSMTCLHLFQILSPKLAERARVFGSKLALKDEWVRVKPPYFDAPGALHASIGEGAEPSQLPPITMVFCIVEGAKDWRAKPTTLAKDRKVTQQIIEDTIVNTLLHVPGYLCRVQEGEFKYMVAFHTAEDAFKWCLIIQDALLWQDWPESILKFEKFKEERNERDEVVFRGPRLKIGMCEGVPRTIIPDHLGRADYHGPSINSAARYMDAAAHGGQVVCEEDLAQKVFHVWNKKCADRPILPPGLNVAFTDSGHLKRNLVSHGSGASDLTPGADGNPGAALAAAAAVLQHVHEGDEGVAHRGVMVPMPGHQRNSLSLRSVNEAGHAADSPTDGEAGDMSKVFARKLAQAHSHSGPSRPGSSRPNSDSKNSAEMDASPATSERLGHKVRIVFPGSDDPAPQDAPPTPSSGSLPRLAAAPYPAPPSPSPAPAEINPRPSISPQLSPRPALAVRQVQAASAPPDVSQNGASTAAVLLEMTSVSALRRTSIENSAGGALPAVSVMRRGSGDGGGMAGPSNRRIRPSVRIQLPDPDERISLQHPDNRGLLAPDARGENMTVWHQPIAAQRIGRYRFKGSPEELVMVYVALECHAGRRYPSEPPKGKGGRVAEESGVAVFCPDVELPTISRKYYLHWRHAHTVKGGPPGTPRGTSKHWGWGLATSRAGSINVRELPQLPAQADTMAQPHTPRGMTLLQAAVARSRTMLAIVRTMSRHSGSSSQGGTGGSTEQGDQGGTRGGSGRMTGSSRMVDANRVSPPRQSAPGGVTGWLSKQISGKDRLPESRLRRATDA